MNLKQRILRTNLVWILTGLSYTTAVIATNSSYVSKRDYLEIKKNQMNEFIPMMKGKKVLEFGCGPGGNLFAIRNEIESGMGIDINKGYIRNANKLKKKAGISNLKFVAYDGIHIDLEGYSPEVIFSIGVFERLGKPIVVRYISTLKGMLKPGQHMVLYFLNERAKKTKFVERLGEDAYIYWQEDEIRDICKDNDLSIENVSNWASADVYTLSVR